MPVYSHSRLSSFEKCPLQYRYRYVDRIKRDTQSIEAFTGNRVHEVLEILYRDQGTSPPPSVEDLVALYHTNWDAKFSDRITIVRKENPASHYRSFGGRCIVNYYRRHAPFTQTVTLGLEQKVHASLSGDQGYRIQGFIDRLALAGPGIYEIHDYKTSNTLPSDSDLRRDRQLSLYQIAVQEQYAEAREIRLVWHYLAFDKDLTSSRTPEELETHRRAAIRAIDSIEAARGFPPRESALCRWCEYRDICPVQKDAVAAEGAAAQRAAAPEPAADPRGRQDGGGGNPRPSRPMEQMKLFS